MIMLFVRHTPRGLKLISCTEINQEKYKTALKSHPLHQEVDYIMNMMLNHVRITGSYRATIEQLWNAVQGKVIGLFDVEVKVLPKTGNIPARLLIKKI